ncbi:MAG: hypothetical protein CM15mP77_3320 [Synechococcus sp.]|nr:MAG: hypothetical protein CM15mP77_3320 [Synechococcus sp.]
MLSGDQRWNIGIFGLGDLVDTTGAGDLYAGGFLHGYTQGDSLERCGQLGPSVPGRSSLSWGPVPRCPAGPGSSPSELSCASAQVP